MDDTPTLALQSALMMAQLLVKYDQYADAVQQSLTVRAPKLTIALLHRLGKTRLLDMAKGMVVEDAASLHNLNKCIDFANACLEAAEDEDDRVSMVAQMPHQLKSVMEQVGLLPC